MMEPVYPAPVQLYGVDLPWVVRPTHLGHELHQDGTMDLDAKMKRVPLIEGSTEIRDAHPSKVLSVVQTYAGHFYYSMLWDLFSDMAGQVYRSWNTCMNLSWSLPRSSHNYYGDGLANSLPFVKKKFFCHNVAFFQKL